MLRRGAGFLEAFRDDAFGAISNSGFGAAKPLVAPERGCSCVVAVPLSPGIVEHGEMLNSGAGLLEFPSSATIGDF